MSTRHVAHGSTLRAKAVYAAGILVAVSLVGFLFVQYARATATYLSPNPPGYSLIADPTLVVGEPFDIGIQFTNMSDHVLIMRPLTLSHGIPAHIHILHQSLPTPTSLGIGAGQWAASTTCIASPTRSTASGWLRTRRPRPSS